ncbi:unnamed protein product, partial [Discosporangium mesarthrocarpum]
MDHDQDLPAALVGFGLTPLSVSPLPPSEVLGLDQFNREGFVNPARDVNERPAQNDAAAADIASKEMLKPVKKPQDGLKSHESSQLEYRRAKSRERQRRYRERLCGDRAEEVKAKARQAARQRRAALTGEARDIYLMRDRERARVRREILPPDKKEANRLKDLHRQRVRRQQARDRNRGKSSSPVTVDHHASPGIGIT